MAQKKYELSPDYAVCPGETLKEVIEDLGMKLNEFAQRTGLTSQSIIRIFALTWGHLTQLNEKNCQLSKVSLEFNPICSSCLKWLLCQKNGLDILFKPSAGSFIRQQESW